MEENKNKEAESKQEETKKTFDDVLTDKEDQAEFDRRISKAIQTAISKRESEKEELSFHFNSEIIWRSCS